MTIEVRTNEPAPKPAPAVEKSAPAKVEEAAPSAHEETSVQKEAEDSETPETEVIEASKQEHEDGAEESDEDKSSESEGEKPKKKGGFKKRIDKLSARVADSERQIEYWKQQALKTQAPPSAEKVDLSPKSNDGKPTPEKFESHSEYVEALTDWKTEQKFKEREAKEQQLKIQSEQSKVLKSHQERVQAFAEKNKDFNDAIAELDDIPASPTVVQLITSSDNGPALMYELAKNRDEFEKLNKLSPLMAARELGRIEARISSKTPDQKVETKKITSAPKPLEPVGKGGKGSTPKSIFDSNLSQAEYEALRREQQKRRRS